MASHWSPKHWCNIGAELNDILYKHSGSNIMLKHCNLISYETIPDYIVSC